MLVEAPLANIAIEQATDIVDLDWSDCHRRAFRRVSRNGETVRFLLKLGASLRHGDVIGQDGDQCIAVNVVPCEVLVATPSAEQLPVVCYELGNLHVAVQLDGKELITIPDGPVEAVFHRLGIDYEFVMRRFEPGLRGALVIAGIR